VATCAKRRAITLTALAIALGAACFDRVSASISGTINNSLFLRAVTPHIH
jgi:hypothetical protein